MSNSPINRCIASGCNYARTPKSAVSDQWKRFYQFPTYLPSTCVAWVRACGNPDLLKLSLSTLKRRGVCTGHFSDEELRNLKQTNGKARIVVVPSKFNHSGPLSNDQMLQFVLKHGWDVALVGNFLDCGNANSNPPFPLAQPVPGLEENRTGIPTGEGIASHSTVQPIIPTGDTISKPATEKSGNVQISKYLFPTDRHIAGIESNKCLEQVQHSTVCDDINVNVFCQQSYPNGYVSYYLDHDYCDKSSKNATVNTKLLINALKCVLARNSHGTSKQIDKTTKR